MADMTSTTHATWIEEQWSDEVQASYEANFVVPKYVKTETFGTGAMKGDVLHFPKVSSLTAADIADNSDIEGQAPTEGEVTVTLNKFKHSSVYVQKMLANNLSKYEFRRHYTDKVGASLAKRLNLDVIATLETMTGTAVGAIDASATDITDQMIRDAMETLDKADVPENERVFILYPDQKSAILGISRFTEMQTSGNGAAISTGKVGDVYGNKVEFTTLISQAGTTPHFYRKGLFFHREAVILAIPKMGPDITYDWVPRRKAWLLSGDILYGSALYRGASGLIVNTDQVA